MNLQKVKSFSFKEKKEQVMSHPWEWSYYVEWKKKLVWIDNTNIFIVQDYANPMYSSMNWWAKKLLIKDWKYISSLYKKSDKLYRFDTKAKSKKTFFDLELLEEDIWIIRKL